MPEYVISGIPVNFPFEPYDVQKAYMAKVIECLQNGTNGVLESPTGTGKTLSLLCSTLAWILCKKAEVQSSVISKQKCQQDDFNQRFGITANNKQPAQTKMEIPKWVVPKVIYSSRTHSQLTQAMHELKRTSYCFMRAVVLGSRDQLCIHPEVSKEPTNAAKTQMCKVRTDTRACYFYNRVESKKDSIEWKGQPVMDIEDLVQVAQKLKMCPYFGSKELVQDADITFMPYNYLLDPKARKANKIELSNTIVILDEAHNVEKMCEESASVRIKSSDVALCIEDVTGIMKLVMDPSQLESGEEPTDFTLDDLALLKEMLLELEKVIDSIEIHNITDGVTFPGSYMFELLQKANIHAGNQSMIIKLLDSLIQFLAVTSQNNSMFRKGLGLEVLADLLTIVFAGKDEAADERIKRSFKVHVDVEESNKKVATKKDGWLSKSSTTKANAKVINYWCFNPGFGMEQLLNKNVHSVILTSGTLAPLKPLIAELSIPIAVRLENPHIVGQSQVCVKIISHGPDKEPLNSSFKNRDNPKYVNSLGRTILSFCPVIPDGLLIFFPSYPLMNKCIEKWQESGIWAQIMRHKPIYVEPKGKDAFATTMNEFYTSINDPKTRGAVFIAVCRGKVSEGLDFADMNGRAVIITGLPFPPFRDPRVILKKKYLEENRTKENELLSGDNWYALEATRAVNQAIGRVIRHKDDYGAILLCDSRFNFPSQKSQLSAWIQTHLNSASHMNFGPIIGEVSRFFRNAERAFPHGAKREKYNLEDISKDMKPNIITPAIAPVNSFNFKSEEPKVEKANQVTSWTPNEYKTVKGKPATSAADFMSRLNQNVSTIDFNEIKVEKKDEEDDSLVTIHKRERSSPLSTKINNNLKKKKLRLVSNSNSPLPTPSSSIASTSTSSIARTSTSTQTSSFSADMKSSAQFQVEEKIVPVDRTELLKLIKNSVPPSIYSIFVKALMAYQKDDNFDDLFAALVTVFEHPSLHYLLKGMKRFVKDKHKTQFDEYTANFVL